MAVSLPSPKNKYQSEVVDFRAGDGMHCNLVHFKGNRPAEKGPVLMVHGAGVRANIFCAPVRTNIVDFLLERGYDVWLENWRASIDLPPNRWTLDQAAVFDHPYAVQKVVEETGRNKIRAIIHCQGSTSFTMSAMAGLVPQVKTIVSNAVSLHPVVPRWSRFKLRAMLPLVRLVISHLNPQWGMHAPSLPAKLIDLFVRLFHHECDNGVCKHVSFTYGSGRPALWRHENLNQATHDWLKQEFAFVPLRFFAQIARCVRVGHLVSVEDLPNLPKDFTAKEPQITARFAFFAGERNRCFLPESQQRSFEYFAGWQPNFHTLHLLPNYGHLDVFMGKTAAKDVFPLMAQELEN